METYLLKSSVSLIILYIGYRVMLRYEFNHELNRFIGLSCVIFSALFPFVPLGINSFSQTESISKTFYVVAAASVDLRDNVSSVISPGAVNIVFLIYYAGIIILSLRSLSGMITLARLYHTSERQDLWGFTVVRIKRNISPFTFFNILFTGTNQLDEAEEKAMILHERVHKDHYHSLDVMALEVLTIIFWFNPVVWLFRKNIREQHEYAADKYVLLNGFEVSNYQNILFKVRTGVAVDFVNHLSSGTSLIKRFRMMSATPSNRAMTLWRVLFFVMLMPLVFFLSSFTEIQSRQVDKPAIYAEGESAMYHRIMNQVTYPSGSREANHSGVVNISFAVTENGIVDNVEARKIDGASLLNEVVVQGYSKSLEISKGVDEALTNESIRVISSLGRFTPAQKDGKNVRSVLMIPIKFKLN